MRPNFLALLTLFTACAAVEPTPTLEKPMTLGTPETRAIVVVRVQSPWWAPAFLITGKLVDAVPDYAMVPGLEQKTFTLSDARQFGGVYLWDSRARAEAWFDEKWHERVRRLRGVEGDVRILDAKYTVMGEAIPVGKALPQHALRTEAAVTWLSSAPGLVGGDEKLKALAEVHGLAPGLIRVSFVTEPDGRVGVVGLWTSRGAAQAFWNPERLARAKALVGGSTELTWFAAPVLLDAAAAKAEVRSGAQPAIDPSRTAAAR